MKRRVALLSHHDGRLCGYTTSTRIKDGTEHYIVNEYTVPDREDRPMTITQIVSPNAALIFLDEEQ